MTLHPEAERDFDCGGDQCLFPKCNCVIAQSELAALEATTPPDSPRVGDGDARKFVMVPRDLLGYVRDLLDERERQDASCELCKGRDDCFAKSPHTGCPTKADYRLRAMISASPPPPPEATVRGKALDVADRFLRASKDLKGSVLLLKDFEGDVEVTVGDIRSLIGTAPQNGGDE